MATTSPQEFEQKWAQIIARSWSDDNYRQSVEADPAAALSAAGINVPDGVIVSVSGVGSVQSNSAMVLPFPPKPEGVGGEATAEDVLGGSCCSSSLVSSSCCP